MTTVREDYLDAHGDHDDWTEIPSGLSDALAAPCPFIVDDCSHAGHACDHGVRDVSRCTQCHPLDEPPAIRCVDAVRQDVLRAEATGTLILGSTARAIVWGWANDLDVSGEDFIECGLVAQQLLAGVRDLAAEQYRIGGPEFWPYRELDSLAAYLDFVLVGRAIEGSGFPVDLSTEDWAELWPVSYVDLADAMWDYHTELQSDLA